MSDTYRDALLPAAVLHLSLQKP
ncbi:hypothetical protein CEXT_555231, partial [Caerostris extrusa]